MSKNIIIIGAGISGLSCAYHLKKYKTKADIKVFEASADIGGLCGSYEQNGFTFDYSGHLLHTATKQGKKLADELLGKNKHTLERQAYILIKDRIVNFPFQNNLRALDKADISACVSDAIKAYAKPKKNTSIFKNWALNLYGTEICKLFMLPYNAKLWSFPLEKLTSDWCSKFIPKSTLEDIIKGAYTEPQKKFGYNSVFDYPKKGGCLAICKGLESGIDKINLNEPVKSIDLENKIITTGTNKASYDKLVSTMPLPEFEKAAKNLPTKIKKCFNNLKHNSLYVLNIALGGKAPKGHWFYFPEGKYPFYRVGVQSAFAKSLAPKNTFSLYIEFSLPQNTKADTAKFKNQTLEALKEIGFIKQDSNILAEKWIYIKYGYPIYDKNYAKSRSEILDYLAKQDIYLLGRYGAWEYSFMEKSLLDGATLAKQLSKVKL